MERDYRCSNGSTRLRKATNKSRGPLFKYTASTKGSKPMGDLGVLENMD